MTGNRSITPTNVGDHQLNVLVADSPSWVSCSYGSASVEYESRNGWRSQGTKPHESSSLSRPTVSYVARSLTTCCAIFLTYLHGDHVLGLPGLLQTLDFNDRHRPNSTIRCVPPDDRKRGYRSFLVDWYSAFLASYCCSSRMHSWSFSPVLLYWRWDCRHCFPSYRRT